MAPVDLRIEMDPRRLRKPFAIKAGSCHARRRRVRIDLPESCRTVRFRSLAGSPADVGPSATDRRKLGVALARLTLDAAPITFDDPCVLSGFCDPEPGAQGMFAWTDGHGRLSVEGERRLSFDVQAQATVWRRESGFGDAAAGTHREIAGFRD